MLTYQCIKENDLGQKINNKRASNLSNLSAFTLLELLLVIAIISVLAGLIMFNLRPADILQDANTTKIKEVSNQVEDAINSFVVENSGTYPFVNANMAQTAYPICKQGESLNCGVNLDTLVANGYMQGIPVNDGMVGNTTGYMLKYTNKVIKVGPSKISCPVGYIGVSGNPLYQTEDFCVMKYEAKNVSSVATSQAPGLPWVWITQVDSITACSNLGPKYHLITNKEWMTIARNTEQVTSNWLGGVVGTNFMYSGHSDGGPNAAIAASVADNDGYFGTSDSIASCDGSYANAVVGDDTITGRACAGQRRTLTLANGEVIWDLIGNVWEWNSDVIACAGATCTVAEMPFDATPASEWVDFININTYGQLTYDLMRPSNVSWDSNHGMGRIYTDLDVAYLSDLIHAYLRGGYFRQGTSSGVFALALFSGASAAPLGDFGFRCAMSL
ncbi:type II secretion system protein [Candidatus Dojkabacteria bacterium]|nr:type II secretion system protein [Candidatus Dojkabacteria bacterium]